MKFISVIFLSTILLIGLASFADAQNTKTDSSNLIGTEIIIASDTLIGTGTIIASDTLIGTGTIIASDTLIGTGTIIPLTPLSEPEQ